MSADKRAYWIAHVTIRDEPIYDKYRKLAALAVAKHSGQFVARGGRYRQMEGLDHNWNTVAVFPSFETALACYESAEYQAALVFAKQSSDRDLVIVEGT